MAGNNKLKGRVNLGDLKGLNFLTSGVNGNIAGLQKLPDSVLQETLPKLIADKLNAISDGVRPGTFLKSINPLAGDYTLLESNGAQANLFDIIDRAQSDVKKLSPDETGALESILGATHDQSLTLDGKLTAPETAALSALKLRMGAGERLTDIANRNFETQEAAAARAAADAKAKADADAAAAKAKADLAAREAAAAQTQLQNQATLEAQVQSGLIYAGLLNDGESLNTGLARLTAFTTREQSTYDSFFTDGKIDADAKAFLLANTAGWAHLDENGDDRLKADLESGTEAGVARAQNFMNLHGASLNTDGKMTQSTFDKGQEEIRAELTVPTGLIRADGTVSQEKLYNLADAGQLYLPIDKLEEADRIAAMDFPLAKDLNIAAGDIFSREQFIAARLIADNPEGYKAILAEENTRRKGLTLQAAVEKPEVTVEADTLAERNEIANNPLGLPAKTQNEEYTPETSALTAAADSVTQDGTLVFSDTEKSFEVFLTGLKSPISMPEAMAAYNEEIGLTQGATNPPLRQGGLLAKELTGNADYQFDLSKPDDVKAILTGVTSFAMAQQETLKMTGDQNYVQALQQNHPALMESIDKVAKGVTGAEPEQKPAPVGPGITPDMLISDASQIGYLRQGFHFAHENLLVRTNAPTDKDLFADNDPERFKRTGTGPLAAPVPSV